MACGGSGNGQGCRNGSGAGGLFTSPPNCGFGFGPGLGGSDFSPFGFNPEVIAAGLSELLPHAAPFLFQMAENFDEKMIEEAIRLSMGDTGTGTGFCSGSSPKPEAGTSRKMKENNARGEYRKSTKDTKYRVDIVLGSDTQPESLKITRKDNVMTIYVKKEKSTQAEDGSLAFRLYQELTKKVTLPENVDLTQLESVLSPDGVLTIQAPFYPKPEEAKPASLFNPHLSLCSLTMGTKLLSQCKNKIT